MPSVSLRVRLTPRADRNALVRWEDGVLYVRVSAPPVGGAANASLIELLAGTTGVRKRAIILKSGASSRDKTIEIEGITQEQMVTRILSAIGGAGS